MKDYICGALPWVLVLLGAFALVRIADCNFAQARYPERFPDTASGILNPAQNQSLDDDVSFCHGDDTDWCCEWDTDGTEGLLCTAADCDGLGGSCTAAHVYEDSGNLIADLKGIDSVTNSSQKITVGPPGASSHSLGANQCHFTCTEEEHEGPISFDGEIEIYGLTRIYHNLGLYSNDFFISAIGGGGSNGFSIKTNPSYSQTMITVHSTAGRQLVFADEAYVGSDHDHDVPPNFTIFVQKTTDPDSDNTSFAALSWNRLALGGDGGGLGCINQTFAYDDMVDGGGTSGTLVLDEGIPDGARVDQSILHSLTGFTGDTSAVITIGDGTDVDRYNTGTPSVFTTNASGCDLGVPSGTAWHDDAKSVTVTITSNADFTSVSAGEATISICYWTP